ncbi:uncharacterized protein LOC121972768 [Zingiber officinale]|uniref:uncharacterized protein LOC121972768 n=1 Tax=Zingiber officinale TaxID=94328 RepID=UPI001C4D3859|nr:uncharacterized protein LOC121972768 [Zingiber officinale]
MAVVCVEKEGDDSEVVVTGGRRSRGQREREKKPLVHGGGDEDAEQKFSRDGVSCGRREEEKVMAGVARRRKRKKAVIAGDRCLAAREEAAPFVSCCDEKASCLIFSSHAYFAQRAREEDKVQPWRARGAKGAGAAGGLLKASDLKKLSLDQLKAVKEQSDLEVNLLEDSLKKISVAAARLEAAASALDDLFLRPKGKKTLVPLTASLYVSGTLDDSEKILVDVGTGYFIEVLPLLLLFC